MQEFKACNPGFYPYIEEIFGRIPEEAANRIKAEVEIVSSDNFDRVHGAYREIDRDVKGLVLLNMDLFSHPKWQIIHTVVHEFAHHVARKGQTGLHEKEAEILLEIWGFKEEVEKVKYSRPILESGGYQIGRQWAKKQKKEDLLEKLEEYFDDWNEDKLSEERFDMLFYDIGPSSILVDMGLMGEPVDQDHPIDEDTIIDDGSHDKGIVWGIMSVVKEIIEKRRACARRSDSEEAKETLRKIDTELKKLFDLRSYREKFFASEEHHYVSEFYVRLDAMIEQL